MSAASVAEGGADRITCAYAVDASSRDAALCKELGAVPFIKVGRNATTAGKGEGD